MGRPVKKGGNSTATNNNNTNNNSSTSKTDLSALTQKPPSHAPLEHDINHRKFLERSLTKSDKEIAALIKLQDTLTKIRRSISEQYGEDILLDIGEGIIGLNPKLSTSEALDSPLALTVISRPPAATAADGGTSSTNGSNTTTTSKAEELNKNKEFRAIIHDFLLRMKLRRKLLNRLSRRLMRTSHAMDGRMNKVHPPAIPKYGDGRLALWKLMGKKGQTYHGITEEELEEWIEKRKVFEKEWMEREEVKKRIEERRKKAREDEGEDDIKMKDDDGNDDVKSDKSQTTDEKMKDCEEAQDKGKTQDKGDSDVKMEDMKEISEGDDKNDETKNTEKSDAKMEGNDETDNSTSKDDKDETPEAITSTLKATTSTSTPSSNQEGKYPMDPLLLDEDYQKDLQKLISYDTDYDKILTIKSTFQNNTETNQTTSTTTAITQEQLDALDKDEENFEESHCTGIGAEMRNLSSKEKVMEWKRWQTEMLSRIPDQPTFKELKMVNRVFHLEERRKLVMPKVEHKEEEKETMTEATTTTAAKEEESAVGKKEEEKKICDEEGNTNKEDDDNSSKDSEKSTTTDNEETAHRKCKSFSLEPVPSFYLQDFQRVLRIHADILTCSIHDSTRALIVEATNEYNRVFRISTETQNQKAVLEAELNRATYQFRVLLNKASKEHGMQVAIAKASWQRGKDEFDAQRRQRKQLELQMYNRNGKPHNSDLQSAIQMKDDGIARRSLTNILDQVVIRNSAQQYALGSDYTNTYRNHPDSTKNAVAATLAHCVDVVAKRVEQGWVPNEALDTVLDGEQYPPFKPPPAPSSDKLIVNDKNETFKQMEQRIKSNLREITKKLEASEVSRSKAWTKLMKARADAGEPAQPQPVASRAPARRAAPSGDMAKLPAPLLKTVYNPPAPAPPRYNIPVNYTPAPPRSAGTGVATAPAPSSMSKYSIEAVKARCINDGSVLPVSAPKKTKDGLFMRPAGRQRKGMDWDAVAGKWVPEGSTKNRG